MPILKKTKIYLKKYGQSVRKPVSGSGSARKRSTRLKRSGTENLKSLLQAMITIQMISLAKETKFPTKRRMTIFLTKT
jgi:hypothetical protein